MPFCKDCDQIRFETNLYDLQAKLYSQLVQEVLSRKCKQLYDSDSLELSASLLELNPEVYTVWNYRREALGETLDAGGDEAVKAAGKELELSQRALARNPKSYASWHHRRWVVEKRLVSLENERALVSKLLDIDNRNFHAWGYRGFIIYLMGIPENIELEYANIKISQNFSNYSAWHYKTALLPCAPDKDREALPFNSLEELLITNKKSPSLLSREQLDDEYNLVKQALYTEPADQSGWLYHRWLLSQSVHRYQNDSKEADYLLNIITKEQDMCKEILDLEPGAKWPLLTLTRLTEMAFELGKGKGKGKELYEKLMVVDPLRKGYYRDAAIGSTHIGLL